MHLFPFPSCILLLLFLLVHYPLFIHPLPTYHSYHSSLLTDGYVRIPHVLSTTEALYWRDIVQDALHQELKDCQKCSSTVIDLTDTFCNTCDTTLITSASTTQKSFYRGRHLTNYQPQLRSLLSSPYLARIAAQVMNVSKVRYYQGTVFIKYPQDSPSAWHQDAAAIPLSTDKIVTLWIALDTLPSNSGPLRFIQGSHLPKVPLPSLRNIPFIERLISMKKWTDDDIYLSLPNYTLIEPLPTMEAGDATVHLGWTLHGSTANSSPLSRPAVAITYFADGSRIHPELLRAEEVKVDALSASVLNLDTDNDEGGLRLSTVDGTSIIVRLLADDKGTWLKWLQARPPILIPGAPVQDKTLTPILYDREKDEDNLLRKKSFSTVPKSKQTVPRSATD